LFLKFYYSKNFLFSISFEKSFFQTSSFSFFNYLRKINNFSNLKSIINKFNLIVTTSSRIALKNNFFFWFKCLENTNLIFFSLPIKKQKNYFFKKFTYKFSFSNLTPLIFKSGKKT
jgi:hypothetical protein